MDDSSPLKPEHGEIAAERFARWLQQEGLVNRITEEEAARLARTFMYGLAVGVGLGYADGKLGL